MNMNWIDFLVPGGFALCAVSCVWILVYFAVRR
jgi:hypothetical protein